MAAIVGVIRGARLLAAWVNFQQRYPVLAERYMGWILAALIAALVLWAAVNADTRQLFVVGVVVGSIFALGALGLTLIYGILKFGNFAHGKTR